MNDANTLATRQSAVELVAIYEQAEREIRQAFAVISAAQQRIALAFDEYCTIERRDVDFDDPDDTMQKVRRRAWSALLDRLELRRFMSVAEWEALDKSVRTGDCPELTAENVFAMAEQFRSRMPEMLEAAIREVFDWLVPRRGYWMDRYKTNDKCEVGRKVVVPSVFERGWSNWHVAHHAQQKLIALENVFTALDGKGQVTKSTHWSAIETIAREVKRPEPLLGVTPYFRFRGFQNGNLHLEMLRDDLLQRFNAVAGGQRLRPPKEAA